ncbi:MAG: cytochrome c3 family protein [Gammaproteobacteria bacterium]
MRRGVHMLAVAPLAAVTPGRLFATSVKLAAAVFSTSLFFSGCAPDSVGAVEQRRAAGDPSADPAYVGAAVCATCHAGEAEAWRGSHHERAMQTAAESSVLGDFSGAEFVHQGVTTSFSRQGSRYAVTTDGPDGNLREFPVKFTFGVYPLQQYLVELPNGKIQALGVAWDSRPAEESGGRWFHVYGDEPIDHDDVLHWTRRAQNWDLMCAECHSTGLVKRYDVAAEQFDTRWSEINVACEACHGRGSAHVAWAKAGGRSDDGRSIVNFDERTGITWTIDAVTGNGVRSAPRPTSREIDARAPCHSRRGRIARPERPGNAFLDAFLPALIRPPLYHADGQIRDEVYVYGSFLQSRMYQKGVTCSDCHDPHSLQLRASGSRVCLQCHEEQKYASPTHHRHARESAGADCLACHMPATTYMQIDARRDHSFRVPQLQLSSELGTPEPCRRCQVDKDAAWSDRAWGTRNTRSGQADHWSVGLVRLNSGMRSDPDLPWKLVADPGTPGIVRATAVDWLARDSQSADLFGK